MRNEGPDEDYGLTIRALLDQVWQFLRANSVRSGHNIVIYQDGRITEAGVEVLDELPGDDTVHASATPEGRAATFTHWGAYNGLAAAATRLREWCADEGLALTGAYWEIYGDWTDDLSKLRTDIFYLLA